MLRATSQFETDRASRYLQAMCKHFAHKVTVEYDAMNGTANMPYGFLKMHVAGNSLHFKIEAANGEALDRMKHVVEAHIVRFAFREQLKSLDWD